MSISADAEEAAWNAYVSRHPLATADHLWGWRPIFEEVFGQRCEYLTAERQGSIVGVLPLVLFSSRLFGRFAVSVPYLNYGGLLADDDGAARALVGRATEAARSFGASHVELRHGARRLADLPYRQHKIGLMLDLPPTADLLWQKIDRKIRNQVRKAQKENLTVTTGGPELIDAFYAIFARNMRDLGTPVYSKQLFAAALRQFGPAADVTVVKQGEKPLAGAIAIAFRGTRLVPWASSLREFRHLCPNMLLYWELLRTSVERGAGVFDFGRSSPGGGTHQFKLQWGAREEPLHWEYVMLRGGEPPNQGPSNPKFAAAIAAWKRMPMWAANVCGPRLARHLP
jgi:FemAB-related protein (PEP-CTERM system-associated)